MTNQLLRNGNEEKFLCHALFMDFRMRAQHFYECARQHTFDVFPQFYFAINFTIEAVMKSQNRHTQHKLTIHVNDTIIVCKQCQIKQHF